jgi:hypothetical protein
MMTNKKGSRKNGWKDDKPEKWNEGEKYDRKEERKESR